MTAPETALAALLASFRSSLGATFPTIARRLQAWDTVNALPALFIVHLSDEDTWSGNALQSSTLSVQLWVYAVTTPDDVPDTVLNGLVAAVAATGLAPDDAGSEQFTLGGLVSWCRIEGTSHYFPGDTGNQAVAVVSVKILLTQ